MPEISLKFLSRPSSTLPVDEGYRSSRRSKRWARFTFPLLNPTTRDEAAKLRSASILLLLRLSLFFLDLAETFLLSTPSNPLALRHLIKAQILHNETAPFQVSLLHLSEASGKRYAWNEHLRADSLHLVFNLSGEGLVIAPGTRLTLLPQSLVIFQLEGNTGGTIATRFESKSAHDFVLLTLDSSSLSRLFRAPAPLLEKNLGLLRRWTAREATFYEDLVRPPVAQAARHAWYQAKTLEVLSLHLFQDTPDEPLFCQQLRQKSHRHTRHALELLHGRLQEPLDLSELALDVGCAPHYLSRLVKQDTGKTLSLHLRAFRIERAAELLASGSANVTEASLEVGYNSLSHFTKAFVEEQGLTPSAFLRRTD